MSRFIFRIHDDLRSARPIRRGASLNPEDALRGAHKEYVRMPRIMLPAPEPVTMRLDEALAARASFGVSLTERPMSVTELGTLLGHALGMRTDLTRKYPSGGALYPIETYLVGNILEGYAPSVFHYHPTAHALEYLWDVPHLDMADIFRSSVTPLSRFLIVFTGMWDRSATKYGDWAYHLAMFEAGHMAQNVLLAATALGAQTRPAGGFDDDTITTLLDLNPALEQPVYTVLLSPKSAHAETARDVIDE